MESKFDTNLWTILTWKCFVEVSLYQKSSVVSKIVRWIKTFWTKNSEHKSRIYTWRNTLDRKDKHFTSFGSLFWILKIEQWEKEREWEKKKERVVETTENTSWREYGCLGHLFVSQVIVKGEKLMTERKKEIRLLEWEKRKREWNWERERENEIERERGRERMKLRREDWVGNH